MIRILQSLGTILSSLYIVPGIEIQLNLKNINQKLKEEKKFKLNKKNLKTLNLNFN